MNRLGPELLGLSLCLTLAACNPGNKVEALLSDDKERNRAIANMRLGTGYIQDRQYSKALTALRRALEADPSYPATYNMLGVLYQQLREYEQAEEYFRKAISLDPDDSGTLNNLGTLLCQLERREEAEELFLTAAKNLLYENPELAWANAGLCAQGGQRWEAAEQYYRRALEYDPEFPTTLLRLAEVSYARGNYLSSRAFLQRYTDITDGHKANTLALGIQIESKMNNTREVKRLGRMLQERFPDSAEAREYRRPTR